MPAMSLELNLVVFVVLAAVVWVAGTKLTIYCDLLSERLGFSREAMGFVFLALGTQLPEIVTNSTGAIRGQGALVVNSMFGGVLMQTAVLAAADWVTPRYALTHVAKKSINLLQAALLIGLLATALGSSLVGDYELVLEIGFGSVVMLALYVAALFILFNYERYDPWRVAPESKSSSKEQENVSPPEDAAPQEQERPTRVLVARALLAAAFILGCGVAIVRVSESLSVQTGLGTSFIGATFLASATSLPELSTTITAVRLGAYSMAVSDILGSNLIMLLLLFPSDALYREGLLFDAIDPSGQFALAGGILLTALYLVGLLRRSPRRYWGLGADSWAVLVCYGGLLVGLYHLR